MVYLCGLLAWLARRAGHGPQPRHVGGADRLGLYREGGYALVKEHNRARDKVSAGQTSTLSLSTPATYSILYILASAGDGTPSSVGSAAINFADGSAEAFNFNTFDWCNGPYGQGGLHPEAVLLGPIGRADVGPSGMAFTYNQDCDFQIYETVVAIDPAHAGVAIASIDFTGAPDKLRYLPVLDAGWQKAGQSAR
jgi:hypothetical protein